MNVICNTRILNANLTGVQRVLLELLKLMPDVQQVKPEGRVPGPVGHAWDQFVLPLKIPKGSLLWSPSNIGPLAVRKQVVTLHDLATFESPEGFSTSFRAAYNFIIPRLLPRVEGVITVSEFTRQRAIERFGLDPARIHAIPLGINHDQFKMQDAEAVAAYKAKMKLPTRYVLFLGSLSARKNVLRLIEAWGRTQGEIDAEVELVLAGGFSGSSIFNGTELPTLPPRTRVMGRIDDAELPLLLAGADLFALPSLYEGFGLPPLEAMACGTAALVSNVTSLPEVVGDAAIQVDPLDIDGIAQALMVLNKPAELKKLSKAGLERAATFTWQKTAQRTMEVFRTCS